MPHTTRNIVLGLIGAGVVGGLAYMSLRTEPVAVDLYEVTRATLTATIDVDGVTRVADLYEIAAPISGVARRSPVAVGDQVVAGETIVAAVEPSTPGLLDARSRLQAEAAVREAEAALNVAETERARAAEAQSFAQSQYERSQALVERGVVSITRLEADNQALMVAEAALAAAEARIAQARGGLDRARAALFDASDTAVADDCCTQIRAPINGLVLAIDTVSERPVLAGTRLLSIGDPAELEIVADLLSSDAVRLPDGARATVERWGGPALDARLLRIEPTARTEISALGIEEHRVDAIFEFTSPPEVRSRLGHGFAVFLRIVELEKEDVLLVPLNATFRHGTGWAVFRATDDQVERVDVTLGDRNARFVEVLSGLAEGDRVVEHPNDALDDGALVVERATY
jgi:HlyD family secretion protein